MAPEEEEREECSKLANCIWGETKVADVAVGKMRRRAISGEVTVGALDPDSKIESNVELGCDVEEERLVWCFPRRRDLDLPLRLAKTSRGMSSGS